MKIRNKKTCAEYSSSTLKDYSSTTEEYGCYIDDGNIFTRANCWEEVIEEGLDIPQSIDWEQRRFELVKSLSSSVCSSVCFENCTDKQIAEVIISLADEMIKQLKNKDK